MSRKKICVATGTRAEYGLLKNLMREIEISKTLDLRTIVTGMHLSQEFGFTFEEIENDNFKIDEKIEILLSSDSEKSTALSMSLGIAGFSSAFENLKPDLLVVLGDRYEIFCAAVSAMIYNIPIAHLHGGESTEGSFDESIRHSITKMSHLHFVATNKYRNRVIQLGEQPKNVFNVGGLGVDSIMKEKLLSLEKLEDLLGFKFLKKNYLITYHPVTLEKNTAKKQFSQLLNVLEELHDTGIIFTLPNSDPDSRVIIEMINSFVRKNNNAKAFTSLGQQKYFSCIKYIDGVIGNSSSGLLEVPTLKKGTINIGDRQKGREKASSVIDCMPNKKSIKDSIKKLDSKSFKKAIAKSINPYGKGGASKKIVRIIEKKSLKNIIKKNFYDLK